MTTYVDVKSQYDSKSRCREIVPISETVLRFDIGLELLGLGLGLGD